MRFHHHIVSIVILIFIFTLSACGGGGGDGASEPGFNLSSSSVTFTAGQNTTTPAPQPVDVSVFGGTVYLGVAPTGPYTSAQLYITSDTTGYIEISASYPSMDKGSYNEAVIVYGCGAPDCSSGEVNGSPKVINVTYNVTWPSGSVGSSCTGSTSSSGTSGSLDTNFCGTGHLLFDSIFRAIGDDDGRAITVDSAGNILVAGHTTSPDGNYDTATWRYTSTGAVDDSFGTDFDSNGVKEGFVTYDSGIGSYRNDVLYAITQDSNGRILVAGSTNNGNSTTDILVMRYTSTGVLDTTFGNNGIFVHNGAAGGNSSDIARGITVDSNGKIVIAGYSVNAAGNYDMVLWRLLENGTLDTSFGGDYDSNSINDGFVKHDNAAGGNANDFGNALIIDSVGRIIVAGSSTRTVTMPYSDRDMVVWRFTTSGTLDTTFGEDYDNNMSPDGFVLHDGATTSASADGAAALALDSSQNIIIAGSSFDTTSDYELVIWRLTTNGDLDTSFGDDYDSSGTPDGYVRWGTDGSWDSAQAIAVDSNDRIIVTGGKSNDLAILRYTSAGVIDSSFGNNGVTTFTNGKGKGIVIKTTGEIVVTGSFYNGSEYDMALWQFVP